eukprot:NODE_1257_length_1005_cov_256.732218_g966_i0.p1 GENE.NODE_1257_length_1005_cov_256.732218_g966_i0~~NODE_1257_length_1005_cov_256.732218_g966_i0.p1  ORF type:complete len:287 (-),score=96.16 NODE_1257_length_1005_cov_256.732218_g966_i0:143-928(-)
MDYEPLSTIPTMDPFQAVKQELEDASQMALTTSFTTDSAKIDDGGPDEKKRRIDVDDPLTDPQEAVAQLRSDLARVQNSIKMAANAHFKLSLRDQEYTELKRQLDNLYTKRIDDLPLPTNALINDHLIVAALARQAAEIHRLREDLEKEKEYNEARKFSTSNLGSLKLVAKLHALLKENASLGNQLMESENPDKWAVIDLYKQYSTRLRAEIKETTQHTEKLKAQIRETEEASFMQQQSAKKSESSRRLLEVQRTQAPPLP